MPTSDVYVVEGAGGDWVAVLMLHDHFHTPAMRQGPCESHCAMQMLVARQRTRTFGHDSSTRHAGASLTYPRDL